MDHAVVQGAAIGDTVGDKSDYSEEKFKAGLKFG